MSQKKFSTNFDEVLSATNISYFTLMEPAIQNATKHFRSLNCVNTIENDRISIPSYSVESILLKFGSDAFEPNILNSRGSSLELVPKMRLYFTTKEWFGLDFDYRLFIMKAFYDNL